MLLLLYSGFSSDLCPSWSSQLLGLPHPPCPSRNQNLKLLLVSDFSTHPAFNSKEIEMQCLTLDLLVTTFKPIVSCQIIHLQKFQEEKANLGLAIDVPSCKIIQLLQLFELSLIMEVSLYSWQLESVVWPFWWFHYQTSTRMTKYLSMALIWLHLD